MAADEKHQVLTVSLRALDCLNEIRGGQRTSRRVEKDLASACVFREQIEAARLNLAHLATAVPPRSLHKLRGDRIRVSIARFADEIDEDLHRVLVLRARRKPKSMVAKDIKAR